MRHCYGMFALKREGYVVFYSKPLEGALECKTVMKKREVKMMTFG